MPARIASICLALLLILLPLTASNAQSTTTSPTPEPLQVHPSEPIVLSPEVASQPKEAGVNEEPLQVHATEPVVLDSATANAPKQSDPTATTHWFSLSGSVFMPSSNNITWYYPGELGGGCIHPTTQGKWRGSLNLIDGTKIYSMWFSYYDYSDSAATILRLMRYDQRGPELEIAKVTSIAGSPSYTGYRQNYVMVSPIFVVDNTWYSYVFEWDGASVGFHEELCSAQVNYSLPPIYGNFLPSINR
jgi:hypothetical protein